MTQGTGRGAAWGALAALAALAAAVATLLSPTGGLRGRYAILGPEGAEVTVHERIDRRLDFPVPQRLDAAYIFNWRYEPPPRGFGFPAGMPPYRIHWRGLLVVPETGRYGFAAEVTGEVVLRIDGAPLDLPPDAVGDRELSAGLHPIEVDYTLAQGDARLVLRWKPPGGRLRAIPERFLAPEPGAPERGGTRRLLALILLAGTGVLVAVVWAQARRGRGPGARIAMALAPHRRFLALGAIVLLALVLRLHDYALVPFHHETADEYQHAWEGWHLLHEGRPAAWSTFPDRYPHDQTSEFRWFGDRYVLVRPYFDHPPLFSLPVGLVASLAGARTFLECTLPAMRLVPILLSVLGIVLLFRLAMSYGASEQAALWATLVYATLPVVVLAHRLVKAESLLAILFMGAVLLAGRHLDTGRSRDLWLAAVLSGLSIWTKATGVAVAVVLIVLYLARGRRRAAALTATVCAGFTLAYLAYAAAFDFGIFMKVIEGQATSKWVSLDGLLDLMSGKVVVKYFGRGWYLWLLLAAGVAAFRRERALWLPLAVYAAVLALTVDQRVVYGWYRIPLYPFLCVAAGLYLEEMLRESDLARVVPFAATAVATGLAYAFQAHPYTVAAESAFRAAAPITFAQTKAAVILFVLLAIAPFVLRFAWDRPWTARLARAAAILLVIVFLVANVVTVRDALETYAATRGVQ